MIVCLLLLGLAPVATAQDRIRIATFHTELERKGPGLLLRDILRGDDQADAVARIIAQVAPDIIVLQGVDYDMELRALTALRDSIGAAGHAMAHAFALPPNTGMPTGLDMDGDGRRGGPRDAQGYGAFSGQGGMAILSRYPVARDQVRDFSRTLWADLEWARLPRTKAGPFPSAEAQAEQRLSTTGHWAVPVRIGARQLTILAFHASPPVFDGPENRNGLRNHDELMFWIKLLDGEHGAPPDFPFVLAGVANLDPVDGDGDKRAIRNLLSDPRLQDPLPMRAQAVSQAPGQAGEPRLDTAIWPAPGPGALRASYILPAADLHVTASGIHWPRNSETVQRASRHRLVWVDLSLNVDAGGQTAFLDPSDGSGYAMPTVEGSGRTPDEQPLASYSAR